MFVRRSEVSLCCSNQRESLVTGANAMSSERDGNCPGSSLLRVNWLCLGRICSPERAGFHRLAGERVGSSDILRGPLRRSYNAAILLRQLFAATLRSCSVRLICTSFSASENVVDETSGPPCGPVPNAGGVPGGGSVVCATTRVAAAPTIPADA